MWKVNRRRTPSDGKSSHCIWQGELKMEAFVILTWIINVMPKIFWQISLNSILVKYFFNLTEQMFCNYYWPEPIFTRLVLRASGFWCRLSSYSFLKGHSYAAVYSLCHGILDLEFTSLHLHCILRYQSFIRSTINNV
jgi:hypothetical protein